MFLVLLMLFASAAFAQSPGDVVGRDFYWAALRAHLTNERFIPAGTPVMIGDSRIQNVDFYPRVNVVNFGITGDTTAGMLNRMRLYKNLTGPVFLAGGVNDLGFGEKYDAEIVANHEKMIAIVPHGVSVYVLGVFPVIGESLPGYSSRIRAINKQLRTVCHRRPGCSYVDVWTKLSNPKWQARPEYMAADGIHLNAAGSSVIVEAAIRALKY